MSTDRFVRWRKDKRPLPSEIEAALERYIGIPSTIDRRPDRILVDLPGKAGNPFPRPVDEELFEAPFDSRTIEVYIDPLYTDVITRQADEFTCAVAEGFARAIARHWNGRRE